MLEFEEAQDQNGPNELPSFLLLALRLPFFWRVIDRFTACVCSTSCCGLLKKDKLLGHVSLSFKKDVIGDN